MRNTQTYDMESFNRREGPRTKATFYKVILQRTQIVKDTTTADITEFRYFNKSASDNLNYKMELSIRWETLQSTEKKNTFLTLYTNINPKAGSAKLKNKRIKHRRDRFIKIQNYKL